MQGREQREEIQERWYSWSQRASYRRNTDDRGANAHCSRREKGVRSYSSRHDVSISASLVRERRSKYFHVTPKEDKEQRRSRAFWRGEVWADNEMPQAIVWKLHQISGIKWLLGSQFARHVILVHWRWDNRGHRCFASSKWIGWQKWSNGAGLFDLASLILTQGSLHWQRRWVADDRKESKDIPGVSRYQKTNKSFEDVQSICQARLRLPFIQTLLSHFLLQN